MKRRTKINLLWLLTLITAFIYLLDGIKYNGLSIDEKINSGLFLIVGLWSVGVMLQLAFAGLKEDLKVKG